MDNFDFFVGSAFSTNLVECSECRSTNGISYSLNISTLCPAHKTIWADEKNLIVRAY